MLFHLLFPLAEQYPVFNVFRYITFRAAGAVVTALLLTLWMGPWFIRMGCADCRSVRTFATSDPSDIRSRLVRRPWVAC